jgi:hypothetical protein
VFAQAKKWDKKNCTRYVIISSGDDQHVLMINVKRGPKNKITFNAKTLLFKINYNAIGKKANNMLFSCSMNAIMIILNELNTS